MAFAIVVEISGNCGITCDMVCIKKIKGELV